MRRLTMRFCRISKRLIAFAVIAVSFAGPFSLGLHVTDAAGGVWTINDLGDSSTTTCQANAGSGGPTCQLRDALSHAVDSDTVTFAAGLNGTILLDVARGTLTVTSNVAITGPGASSLAIDGNKAGGGTFAVFAVNSGVTASISDLTVQNGTDIDSSIGGAGIRNAGTLTINHIAFLNNTYAPPDFSYPMGGAGLYNTGILTVNNSTFSGNSSSTQGGGLFNAGTSTVSNSTFSNNAASGGGGISNFGTLIVSNSTISGNSGSEGIGIYEAGPLSLLSTIIAQNGGSDLCCGRTTVITLGHNLIGDGTDDGFTPAQTDKVGTSISPINPLLGAVTNNGGQTQTMALPVNSLAFQSGDCTGNTTVTPPAPAITQDQRGQSRKSNCDIGAFEETFSFNPNSLPNGIPGVAYTQAITASGGTGPYTYHVMAPGTGLPPGMVFSAPGVLSGTPTGNRVSTFMVAAADSSQIVGMYFYTFTVSGPTATWTVNVNTDNGLTSCQRNAGAGGPACELRDALARMGDGDTITFAGGLSSPILLNTTLGTLTVTFNLTLTGPGTSSLAIDGNRAGGGTFPVITVNKGVIATISGLTIQNGHATAAGPGYGGGAIFNNGMLTISDGAFNNNTADYDGGAICNNGLLTVSNSVFLNNIATFDGGAIVNNGTLTISNSTISANTSDELGGAIFNSLGQTLTLNDSVISGNAASLSGGGFDAFGGVVIVNGSTISNNTTSNSSTNRGASGGGGISNRGAKMTISNSTIANNAANNNGNGGGINNYGMLTISNSTLSGNTANNGGNGGGIYNSGALNLLGSLIAKNTITGSGAGTGPDINNTGAVNTFGHNLIGDGTASGLSAAAGDQIGTSSTPIDPLLNGLAANGGLTQTMALQGGSPAVNQGDCSGNTSPNPPAPAIIIDQRGVHRKTPCDMGAYESLSAPRIESIGVFRSGTFYLRLHNSTGFADIVVVFHSGVKPYPVVGDWTDTGFQSVGVFDQSNGQFSLCTTNDSTTCSSTTTQIAFVLGAANDMPLSGHWQIGAPYSGVGVFRPSNGLLYLKNALSTGFADDAMVMGIPGDIGLTGDWNGDGQASPGVYRPSTQRFYLTDQVCNCSITSGYSLQYGVSGDAPVIGDWIGQGHDGVGLFRQSNGFTYLRNTLTTGYADNTFTYGIAGDVPVAGHWQLVYPPAPNLGSVLVSPTAAPVPADKLSD